MECLFRTTTKYTYEEYKRYNRSLNIKRFLLFASVTDAVLLFLAVLTWNWLFYLMLAIVFPTVLYLSIALGGRKMFMSTKAMQDLDVSFEFFDEYFVTVSANGENKYYYNELHKIVETKTNFYLMIGARQGCMLSKANIPDGLDEFLRNKGVKK